MFQSSIYPNLGLLDFFHPIIIFQGHLLSTHGVALTDAKAHKAHKASTQSFKTETKNKEKNIHTCQ
jgi:hypothetical protein